MYSSLTAQELSDLKNEKYEKIADLQDLNLGDEVAILWSGGNGPHRYIITRIEKDHAFVKSAHLATVIIENVLDYVGPSKPFTQVWRMVKANE